MRAHDGAAVEATATNEVGTAEEFGDDALDVLHGHFVDEAGDALFESVPTHSLILDTTRVGCSGFGHERLETCRRNICSTRLGSG